MLPGASLPDRPSGDDEEGGFRADLVARVRKEIAAGTYETPEKLQAALERLLAKLASQ
jgi:hypothetical protein